jgi:hypothetical protein
MLTKIIGLLLLIAATLNTTLAQRQDSLSTLGHPVKYYNSVLAGCVVGSDGAGTGASVMMYHGIRFKRFGAAAGIGIDSYERWRTLPVQLRISYDVVHWSEASAFYVAGAVGHSRSWIKFETGPNYFGDYRSSGGHTINPCIGIRTGNGRWKFYAEVGYKYQRVNWSITPEYHTFAGTSGGGFRYGVEENMERFQVMIGLGMF